MPHKLKILVIDDHKFTLDVVTDILSDEGCYDVYAYASLPRLDFVKILQPDIVLIDCMLQHADGRHICEILRRDPVLSSVRIIIFSAYLDKAETALAAGANAFLRKPFNIDELLTLIAAQKNSPVDFSSGEFSL
jgi:CheY-like chemotaxis protein